MVTEDKNLNTYISIQKLFDILEVMITVGKVNGSCWVMSSVYYESARLSSSV